MAPAVRLSAPAVCRRRSLGQLLGALHCDGAAEAQQPLQVPLASGRALARGGEWGGGGWVGGGRFWGGEGGRGGRGEGGGGGGGGVGKEGRLGEVCALRMNGSTGSQ